MKRTTRHALLGVCLSTVLAPGVFAQQDFSKVEIKTTKLANNLYSLEGQGGAIGVLTGPDGVLMVDSQFAPLTERIVAKPTSDYDAKMGDTGTTGARFIGQLYAELGGK